MSARLASLLGWLLSGKTRRSRPPATLDRSGSGTAALDADFKRGVPAVASMPLFCLFLDGEKKVKTN
jgi:hypothetical protein